VSTPLVSGCSAMASVTEQDISRDCGMRATAIGPSGQRSIVRCEPPRFYRTRLRPDGVPITDGGSIATDIRQCLVALEVRPKSVGRLGYAVVLDRIEQRESAECLASGLNEECSPSALVALL